MKINALSQLMAKNLLAGKYADGQGLWLVKREPSKGRWMLRLASGGKRREMGLGSWPDVSIAEARDRAAQARYKLRDGIDPIAERRKQRANVFSKGLSIAEAITSCFEAKEAELRGQASRVRWISPLKVHVIPKIGHLPIADLDQHVLKNAFEPIWNEKSETAKKALNRIEQTLKHAAAMGLDVDLQATMKAKALLGKQKREINHIPSLPYPEMPQFYRWLSSKDHTSALALRFLILTVTRTSEVRFATWDEIKDDLWIIPANRTKTNQEHRIPLTDEALSVLKIIKPFSVDNLLFPTPQGKAMSDAAMIALLKREGYTCRPHGFRASFRAWVEEQTDTPFEIKETALGHVVDSKVVAAYQRSDRLEKRRGLLEQWSKYLVSFS